MTKIIEGIQNNPYINSFKNAINKVAFLNIALAVLVLLYKGADKFFTLPNRSTQVVQQFYFIIVIFFSLILIHSIVNEHLSEAKESSKMSLIFLAFIFILPFSKALDFLPAFPILGSLFAYLLIFLTKNKAYFAITEIENVPQAATNYFNLLFPILTNMLLAAIPLVLFYRYFNQILFIYMSLIQISSSLVVLLMVVVLICLFWYLGLHGVGVVSSIMRPLWFQMLLFNTYFALLNAPLPYIGTETFLQWFVWLGGSGATLGLSLSIRYLSKSKQLKDLGQTSFNASLHNINEGIIFGAPIVKNKHFAIPFFLSPILMTLIGYGAIAYGLVDNFAIVAPWVLPIPFGSLMSSLGSLKTMLLSVSLIVLSWLIYYPFFKVYDRKLVREESRKQ